MDLSRRTALLKSEEFEIASTMHALVLDSLFRETNWKAPSAVFHGGTALALARDSLRFSEDLDFMVTPEAVAGLERVIEMVRARTDKRMEALYKGGRVDLKGPNGSEVTRWELTWRHPNKHGKVMVKAEFFVAKPDLLAAYKSTHVVPTSRGAFGISTPIPVPELVSAWADKIKAIATRPEIKWRDAYDVAWIVRCLKREDEIAPEDLREALAVTAAIYDKTLEDVSAGLEGVLASGVLEDVATFEEKMKPWFLDDDLPRYISTGYFRNALAEARREVERSLALIRDAAPGVKP